MNKQNPPHGIEWTRIANPDGTRRNGYTWNPTGGCLHGCTWKMPDGSVTQCYAKTVAEGVASPAYPEGFEHHYWRPDQLTAPLSVKKPAGIFVGSMADLFGYWVAKEQIQSVLDTMRHADWHIFQTLSKNPKRLPEFSPFPSNVWVGASVPAGHQMKAEGAVRATQFYLKYLAEVKATVRFMSIEPLWFDVAEAFEQYIDTITSWGKPRRLPLEWVIIGAASNGRTYYQPDPAHLAKLLQVLNTHHIPVFYKGNLEQSPRREEFPATRQMSIFELPGVEL